MMADSTVRWLITILDVSARWAPNLEYAVRLFDEQLPSLILSDNQLPDGLGIDFLIQIKEKYPDIPCILWSGYLSRDDYTKAEPLEGVYEKGISGLNEVGDLIRNFKVAAE